MSLSITSLNKSFADIQALSDINLTLQEGEFVALLGPSGCGKTTLLRAIAGLENPDEGVINIANTEVFNGEKKLSMRIQDRHLGMVFQDFALWPHMSVFEKYRLWLKGSR